LGLIHNLEVEEVILIPTFPFPVIDIFEVDVEPLVV
jgi:hypothetical protein